MTDEDEATFLLTYMGETLDEFDEIGKATAAKAELVRKVMADELPDFLTSDDFEDRADCESWFHVVEHVEL